MIDNKSITENNCLIAEFMGGHFDQMSKSWTKLPKKQDGYLTPVNWAWSSSDLRYHESWDWLIPVVEKIEEELSKISYNTPYDSAFNGTVNTDIQVAYWVVVEFIKWYNQNKS